MAGIILKVMCILKEAGVSVFQIVQNTCSFGYFLFGLFLSLGYLDIFFHHYRVVKHLCEIFQTESLNAGAKMFEITSKLVVLW